jgi:AraC-like DNA-binding protein
MYLSELNPYLRRAIHYSLSANWHIPVRALLDYEILYMESGKSTLIYNGMTYSPHAGDVLLMLPGISHETFGGEKPCLLPHIHFDVCCDNYSDSRYICFLDVPQMSTLERKMIAPNFFADYPPKPILTISDMPRFLKLFYAVIDTDTPVYTPNKKAWMTELLGMVIDDNFPGVLTQYTAEGPSVAHSIRNFLDANYAAEVTLEDLEERFFYNRFYLEAQFRKQYHMPIMTYRNQKRMEVGADLLHQNSVSRVAYKVGYASVFSFCRAFKKHFGMTPTRYVQTNFERTSPQHPQR